MLVLLLTPPTVLWSCDQASAPSWRTHDVHVWCRPSCMLLVLSMFSGNVQAENSHDPSACLCVCVGGWSRVLRVQDRCPLWGLNMWAVASTQTKTFSSGGSSCFKGLGVKAAVSPVVSWCLSVDKVLPVLSQSCDPTRDGSCRVKHANPQMVALARCV